MDDLAQRTQAPPSEVVNKAVEAALQPKQVLSSLARHGHTHPGSQSSQGSGSGCVKCKKADTSYHGQEMGQGWKTNEKMCEVRQVGLEASYRAALEDGGLGAESLWYRGDGCAAFMGQARRGQERLKLHNAEVEAGA